MNTKSKTLKLICSFLLFAILMLGMSWNVQAATYYGKTGVSPHFVGSWGDVSGGAGNAPTNFTTAGDIFIIENGTTMTATAAWTIGRALTTASTLQINSGGTTCYEYIFINISKL